LRPCHEYKSNHVDLVDFNDEGKCVNQVMLDQNAHPIVGRLAVRLFDPEAFVICATIPKTHNYAVATLSVRNMVVGSALHTSPKATETFNHKRFFHAGFHLVHYNIPMTAQSMSPHWSVAVLDAFRGMEGNGPAVTRAWPDVSGTLARSPAPRFRRLEGPFEAVAARAARSNRGSERDCHCAGQ
jgi:uncharacterized protein (DUF362 family)